MNFRHSETSSSVSVRRARLCVVSITLMTNCSLWFPLITYFIYCYIRSNISLSDMNMLMWISYSNIGGKSDDISLVWSAYSKNLSCHKRSFCKPSSTFTSLKILLRNKICVIFGEFFSALRVLSCILQIAKEK